MPRSRISPASSLVQGLEHGNATAVVGGFDIDGLPLTDGKRGFLRVWPDGGIGKPTERGKQRGRVIAMATCPRTGCIATAGWGRTIVLWQRDGSKTEWANAHEDWILCLAFSPDGRRLVSGSNDRTLRIWDVTGSTENPVLRVLQGHAGAVRGVAWSPDGAVIASGASDQTARLWAADGDPIAVLRGHRSTVNDVAFATGGRLLTASDDGSVRTWPASEAALLEHGRRLEKALILSR